MQSRCIDCDAPIENTPKEKTYMQPRVYRSRLLDSTLHRLKAKQIDNRDKDNFEKNV